MMVELTPELIKELASARNGFYSWDYVAALAFWIIGVEAENERLQILIERMQETIDKAIDDEQVYEIRIAKFKQFLQDQALTISQNDYAYSIDKEMMEAEIKASNDLLRSAWMIASRDGKDTNWEAWRKQLNSALERQHAMMYKQQENEG